MVYGIYISAWACLNFDLNSKTYITLPNELLDGFISKINRHVLLDILLGLLFRNIMQYN